MSSSQKKNTALATCTVINLKGTVYCKNPFFQLTNGYESDIFTSDSNDLNRFSATAICGSWSSNTAGKHNAATTPQKNTTKR